MSMQDSIGRFSVRAGNYEKYRPTYPHLLFDYLTATCAIGPGRVIADIGAGTGILTLGLAGRGSKVMVVEPNPEMRQIAADKLKNYADCELIAATAEVTTLPDRSVHLITCAQSFHWFNAELSKAEFRRIAAPDAHLAVVWNTRNTVSAFEAAYEQLIITYSADYLQVSQHKLTDQQVLSFFAPHQVSYMEFEHADWLNFEQLRGRVFSYSFMPHETDPLAPEIAGKLQQLFDHHHQKGQVHLSYKTRLFLGRI